MQGTVVSALTGEGLAKATMILRSSDTERGISYEADSKSHFRIDDIQPGEYSVTAERQSYFQQPDGTPGSPPPRLKIAAGDPIDHVLIKMAPICSMSDRAGDQDGDPVRGATVHVMQYVYVAGHGELRPGIQVQTRDKVNIAFSICGRGDGATVQTILDDAESPRPSVAWHCDNVLPRSDRRRERHSDRASSGRQPARL